MRQMISSGSVKAIYLDRDKVLEKLRKATKEALKRFPEMREVLLFGSFSKRLETGLSDIDLFIVAEDQPDNPLDRIRPYLNFFSERLNIGIDIIVATPQEKEHFKDILKDSRSCL